jgi:hypothetical protein
MAQVKGKFIGLAGQLMSLYKADLAKADGVLYQKTKKHYDELEPEGWYETSLFDLFMETYAKASPTGERAIITLGRRVYPTIKNSVGLPPVTDPLEFLKLEAEFFMTEHKGPDVRPRKIITAEKGRFIVEAPAPGYNCALFEGVFLGILDMLDVQTGKVVQNKCEKRGDATCEFEVTW